MNTENEKRGIVDDLTSRKTIQKCKLRL